jgi:hypothetical protein
MNEPIPLHERAERIVEADAEFKRAHDADVAGDTSSYGPAECYEEAVHTFRSAAIKYRDIGLGLKAREAWTRSAACRRKIAEEEEHYAKVDEESRDAIEYIWEDTQ